MSRRPLVPEIAKVLGQDVAFAEDCIGAPAAKVAKGLKPGGVALLENLRFHAGEEANDVAFAKALAALGNVYVNDAFSAAHRSAEHTSELQSLMRISYAVFCLKKQKAAPHPAQNTPRMSPSL